MADLKHTTKDETQSNGLYGGIGFREGDGVISCALGFPLDGDFSNQPTLILKDLKVTFRPADLIAAFPDARLGEGYCFEFIPHGGGRHLFILVHEAFPDAPDGERYAGELHYPLRFEADEPSLLPPEPTPPPTVAGHAYAISKRMGLTVSQEEYAAFDLIAQGMPIPLRTDYGDKIQSVFVPVEFALAEYYNLVTEYRLPPSVREILQQAQREGCEFITVRTP